MHKHLLVFISLSSPAFAGHQEVTPPTGNDIPIQDRIRVDQEYFLQSETSKNGDTSVVIYEGKDASGARVTRLSCEIQYKGRMGNRMECGGGKLAPIEVLYTPGEADGAAIIYYRVNDELQKKFLRCEMAERDGKVGFQCSQIPVSNPTEEKKLRSSIKGTLAGVPIPNSHVVDKKHQVFRGMAPRSEEDFKSLQNIGVNKILIFKDKVKARGDKKTDVDFEIKKWKDLGLKETDVSWVNFPWKRFVDAQGKYLFKTPCEQTIEALRILARETKAGNKIYFHCTVGEDRTGYLAALYRMITEGGKPHDLFLEEMCERGYEKGDAVKPYEPVTLEVRDAITKTYVRMAQKVKEGQIVLDKLDPKVCKTEPSEETLLKSGFDLSKSYKCRTSTRFRPQ